MPAFVTALSKPLPIALNALGNISLYVTTFAAPVSVGPTILFNITPVPFAVPFIAGPTNLMIP